jgi:hypothetical protein
MDTFSRLIDAGFVPVPTKNPAVRDLINHKVRGIAIHKLPRQKNLCKWCWTNKTPSGRQFYCGDSCKLSIELFCRPQGEESRRFLMKRQDGKCAHCDYDFSLKTKLRPYGTSAPVWDDENKLSFKTDTTYIPDRGEVDHIVPISKGGIALGQENLQLLCMECHRIKSANELRKP